MARRAGNISSKFSGSRADYAYAEIKASIKRKALLPGDRLREVELAESIGVSRTPIREALKRLEAGGLVESVDGGFRVRQFSLSQIIELYTMREVIVGAAARFAANHASPMEIESMREVLEKLRTATSPQHATEQNSRLHQLIAVAGHNSYLMSIITTLNDRCALLGPSTYGATGRLKQGYQENLRIVDAIANREPDIAEAAAREHIRTRLKLLLSLMNDASTAHTV